MIAFMRDNDELQMNAYCDGELDPASAIEFERRLADDETLRAQYKRLLSLRRTVRSLPQYDVPAGLEARIQSALDADRPRQVESLSQVNRPIRPGRPRQRSWSFQALAAAAVFGAVISSSVMLTMERYDDRRMSPAQSLQAIFGVCWRRSPST
jgi:anti-sigma factor RsiW